MIKNKYLIIILVFFILYFLINSNVFAISTSAGEYTNFPSPITEENYEIVLVNHGSWTSNDHWIAFPKAQGFLYMSGNTLSYYNNTTNSVKIYYGDAIKNSITIYRNPSVAPNNSVSWAELGVDSAEEGNYDTDQKRHIIYTNSVVYTSIEGYEKKEIFFPVTPPLEVQITEITQVEEIPKMITEVLKLIIPIGLVVLSVVLTIYLVRLVILRAI